MGLNNKQLGPMYQAWANNSVNAYEKARGRQQESAENQLTREHTSGENVLERDARLAQLIKGKEVDETHKIAERDRNISDLLGIRKVVGPDARIQAGDRTYDPRTDVAGRGKPPQKTVFQETFDRESAKDIAEDINKGGPVQRAGQVAKLKDIEDDLGKSDNISGPIVGLQPKWMRNVTAPQSVRVQEDYERIEQETLKDTLGGQFAQQEAKEFFARAFNPSLEEGVNKGRIAKARQLKELVNQEKASQRAYAMKNQTMEGYPLEQADARIAKAFRDAWQQIDAENKGIAPQKETQEAEIDDATAEARAQEAYQEQGPDPVQPETKTISGVTYQKVNGGWKRIK